MMTERKTARLKFDIGGSYATRDTAKMVENALLHTSIQVAMLLWSGPAWLKSDADTMTVGVEVLGVVKFTIWEWNVRIKVWII